MEEIEILNQRVSELETKLEELSISFELFKLKHKTNLNYLDAVAPNPYVYNKRDFT